MVISARSSLESLTSEKLFEFNLKNLKSVKHDVLAQFTMYLINDNVRIGTENGKLVKENRKLAKENNVLAKDNDKSTLHKL